MGTYFLTTNIDSIKLSNDTTYAQTVAVWIGDNGDAAVIQLNPTYSWNPLDPNQPAINGSCRCVKDP